MNLPARFDHTFRVEVVIAFVVFGLIVLVFSASIVRSFTARGRTASQKTSYKRTEVFWTSLVAAMMIFLVTFSFTENRSTTSAPAMTVDVTAFQWCWRFEYPGSGVSVTADCVNGDLPTLEVPSGEAIRFRIVSADVIHAMWIPHLRFKMFAYPNWTNTFENTFPEPGTWLGECSEFCGQYHYAMHFRLTVTTPAGFHSWLQSHGAAR
ncbi:MAG: cytochrome c oxidase subunit II [Acidobacteriota bacterium]|nr:cytochrome c oxidase subunit II [Acidobacteriota bacterium]